jgi:outer membrane protein W
MKGKLILLATIVGLVCLIENVAAQDVKGLGIRIGGIQPKDIYSGWDASSAVIYGGDFTYPLNRTFAFRFGLDYYNYDFEVSGKKIADLTVLPFSIGMIAQQQVDRARPYIGIGASYLFNDMNLSGSPTSPSNQTKESIQSASIKNSFGFFINGGVETSITPALALGLDLRYLWSSTDLTLTTTGHSYTKSVDLDGFSAGVTFRFYF